MSDPPVLRVAGDRVDDTIVLISRIVADLDVADSLPSDWNHETSPPFIVVEGDGIPISSPAHTSQAIRVRVHATDRPTAYRLMDILDALLQAHSHTGMGFRLSPGQNLLVTRDNEAGGYVAGAGYSAVANRKGIS